MSLKTAKYRQFFDVSAQLAGLPSWKTYSGGVWLEALCLTESSGDPSAEHYDAGHDGGDPTEAKEWTSYGLFQIEGTTAKSYLSIGAVSDFDWLFHPQLNTAIAIGVLLGSLSRYNSDVPKTLAAYNGGGWGARVKPNGDLNNQAYVDRVEAQVRAVLADRA
jgi:hypothetical protein